MIEADRRFRCRVCVFFGECESLAAFCLLPIVGVKAKRT